MKVVYRPRLPVEDDPDELPDELPDDLVVLDGVEIVLDDRCGVVTLRCGAGAERGVDIRAGVVLSVRRGCVNWLFDREGAVYCLLVLS